MVLRVVESRVEVPATPIEVSKDPTVALPEVEPVEVSKDSAATLPEVEPTTSYMYSTDAIVDLQPIQSCLATQDDRRKKFPARTV